MYYLLAILCGSLTASMLSVNGSLTTLYGTYTATVIIHLVGLIFITLYLKLKGEPFLPKERLPLYYFLGGAIGVGTTVFNNIAVGALNLSAILALSLLGQSITSIVIDHFGLMGMPIVRFDKKKIIGLLFVLVGIFIIISS